MTRKYHYIPIRMAKMERLNITSVGEDVEKLKLSYTHDGNVKWCSHFGKQSGSFLKTKAYTYALIRLFYSWVFMPPKESKRSYKYLYVHVHSSFIYNRQDSLSVHQQMNG